MRFLLIASFVCIASFGIPSVVSAQTCSDGCSLIGGVCVPDDAVSTCTTISQTNPSQVQTVSQPNTTQTQSQPNTTGKNITLINPLKSGTSIESFLNNILAYVIRIGTIVVILMIVYVGYLFVIAQGKPGEIEKARTALLWTVVGALILLGSQAIAISIKATVVQLGGGS